MSYRLPNILKELSVLDNINLGKIINFAGTKDIFITSDISGNIIFNDSFNQSLTLSTIRAISTAQGTSKLKLDNNNFRIAGELDSIALETTNNTFKINNNGYFGFGTDNPSSKFHFH